MKKIEEVIKNISFAINNWKLVNNGEKKKIKIFIKIKKIIRYKKKKIIRNKLILTKEKKEKKEEKILNPLGLSCLNQAPDKPKNPPKKDIKETKLKIHNKIKFIDNYEMHY